MPNKFCEKCGGICNYEPWHVCLPQAQPSQDPTPQEMRDKADHLYMAKKRLHAMGADMEASVVIEAMALLGVGAAAIEERDRLKEENERLADRDSQSFGMCPPHASIVHTKQGCPYCAIAKAEEEVARLKVEPPLTQTFSVEHTCQFDRTTRGRLQRPCMACDSVTEFDATRARLRDAESALTALTEERDRLKAELENLKAEHAAHDCGYEVIGRTRTTYGRLVPPAGPYLLLADISPTAKRIIESTTPETRKDPA